MEVKALDPRVPPAPMFRVEPSVPAKVMVLETVKSFPEATLLPKYVNAQLAAVVGVATSEVKTPEVPPERMTMVLPPEDWTVTAPLLWFTIVYCPPATTEVVGSLTVWVVEPVKYCSWVEAMVRVVVPAAVAVVVKPEM